MWAFSLWIWGPPAGVFTTSANTKPSAADVGRRADDLRRENSSAGQLFVGTVERILAEIRRQPVWQEETNATLKSKIPYFFNNIQWFNERSPQPVRTDVFLHFFCSLLEFGPTPMRNALSLREKKSCSVLFFASPQHQVQSATRSLAPTSHCLFGGRDFRGSGLSPTDKNTLGMKF